MSTHRSFRGLVWLGTGLFLGIGYGVVGAADKPAPDAPNPNVVVLRSTKRITLEAPKMSWGEFAAELTRQTGYRFSIDPSYAESKMACAYLFKEFPLANVLGLSSYLSGGVWERGGSGYHLREKTFEEVERDADRYHALLVQAKKYVDQVPKDRLNRSQLIARDALEKILPDYYNLSEPPQPWMDGWTLTITEGGFSLNQVQEIKSAKYTIGSSKVVGGSW